MIERKLNATLACHVGLEICGGYLDVMAECDKYSEGQGWITHDGEVTRLNSQAIEMHYQINEADEAKLGCLENQGYRRLIK